jgi:hypothetical protein
MVIPEEEVEVVAILEVVGLITLEGLAVDLTTLAPTKITKPV